MLKRLIMIIEDNKADVFIIREALDNAGVDATLQVVNDGHAAIEFFDAVDRSESAPCPDLVLLDMNLPKKSGGEVMKHLRESTRCRNVPVVIVSSSDSRLDRSSVSGFSIAAWFKKASEYTEYMKLGPLVRGLLDSEP